MPTIVLSETGTRSCAGLTATAHKVAKHTNANCSRHLHGRAFLAAQGPELCSQAGPTTCHTACHSQDFEHSELAAMAGEAWSITALCLSSQTVLAPRSTLHYPSFEDQQRHRVNKECATRQCMGSKVFNPTCCLYVGQREQTRLL